MFDVERLAERVVMLHEGRVLLDSSLDDLRERYALALVPQRDGVSRDALLGLDGCLAARERASSWHAVFHLDVERTRALLERELGITDARARRVGLEEMYIELVGGQL
jgi:ABC-type uncharacterized transport system ATPase subunit